MDGSMILTLIKTIVVLLIIIAMANMSLKYLSKKMQNSKGSMDIVDKVQVTNTSSIAIVRVLEDYYLMSISEAGNNIMKELTEREIDKMLETLAEGNQANIRSITEKINKLRKKGI